MAPSQHDWKIVDWDVKPQHNQPDRTAPLGAVWSGSALFAQTCLSENLGTLQYSMVKSSCSDFRVITANVSSVWIFRIFMAVLLYSKYR